MLIKILRTAQRRILSCFGDENHFSRNKQIRVCLEFQ